MTPNLGRVTAIRGSVVDVRFDVQLPQIRTLLRAGADDEIAIEVAMNSSGAMARSSCATPNLIS